MILPFVAQITAKNRKQCNRKNGQRFIHGFASAVPDGESAKNLRRIAGGWRGIWLGLDVIGD